MGNPPLRQVIVDCQRFLRRVVIGLSGGLSMGRQVRNKAMDVCSLEIRHTSFDSFPAGEHGMDQSAAFSAVSFRSSIFMDHFSLPLATSSSLRILFLQNIRYLGKVLTRLFEVRQHTIAVYHFRPGEGGIWDPRAPACLLKVGQCTLKNLVRRIEEVHILHTGKIAARTGDYIVPAHFPSRGA